MPVGRSLHWLPRIHRRWILANAIAGTAVINLILNGGIAWLSAIGVTRVPLWATPIVGGPSTITDTIGTLFLLPLITNALVVAAVHRDLRSGRLAPLQPSVGSGPILRLLQHHWPTNGFALGAGCLGSLGPPAFAILMASHFGDIPTSVFVLYKAILGVTLGAIVTPLIAVHAIASTSPAAHCSSATQTTPWTSGEHQR